MRSNFVFFGSSIFSIFSLDQLKRRNFLPSLIVTLPDRPRGRGMKIQANIVKEWAQKNQIPTLETDKLNNLNLEKIKQYHPQVLLVVASSLFVPPSFLKEFKNRILNLHPSLLPKYRGPAPLQNLILNNDLDNAGISLIVIDNKIDHGKIIAKERYQGDWPIGVQELGKRLFEIGTDLFVNNLEDFLVGKIKLEVQDDELATMTKKLEKSDGEINLNDEGVKNYLKYLAYNPWPGVFYFENKKKVKIKKARLYEGSFLIEEKIVVSD